MLIRRIGIKRISKVQKMFFFSNLCILCLNKYENLKSVLNKDNVEIIIQTKLKYCFPEIVNLGLEIPKYICSNCMNKLEHFNKFKRMCLRNNTNLKKYLQTLTSTDDIHHHLSVTLTDIKYQNSLQAVSNYQTFPIVRSENKLETGGQEDNVIKETVFENEIKLDVEQSHLLLDEDKIVKEECLLSENSADIEYYQSVKNIMYESKSSNSDVSISDNEDVKDDFKYSNHSENISANSEEKKVTVVNRIKQTGTFQCAICGSKYLHKYLLRYHLKIHAGVKVQRAICEKTVARKHSIKHEQIHRGVKNFECAICKKMFFWKSSLIAHEKIHTGSKKFECSICKKKFWYKNNLVQHKQIHTGTKNFECAICKKEFVWKRNLTRHEKIHTGTQEFECSICKKKFWYKDHLIQHKQIHTGSKNFECAICKKKFLAKRNLIRHEKIHSSVNK